jgi:hypothetical protein
MNVEIGAEAAQFPEKEYINGIAVAVYHSLRNNLLIRRSCPNYNFFGIYIFVFKYSISFRWCKGRILAYHAGVKSTLVKNKHIPLPPACSSTLITEALPGSWPGWGT